MGMVWKLVDSRLDVARSFPPSSRKKKRKEKLSAFCFATNFSLFLFVFTGTLLHFPFIAVPQGRVGGRTAGWSFRGHRVCTHGGDAREEEEEGLARAGTHVRNKQRRARF